MCDITFRQMTIRDIPWFIRIRNECRKYLFDSAKYSVCEAKQWFKNQNNLFYVLTVNKTDIGYFRTSNLDKTNKSIYVGLDIHKNFRGKGLAYKSYLLFMKMLHEKFGIVNFLLKVLDTNVVAKNLYSKLGFKEVIREIILKDSVYVDYISMKLEWKDLCQI